MHINNKHVDCGEWNHTNLDFISKKKCWKKNYKELITVTEEIKTKKTKEEEERKKETVPIVWISVGLLLFLSLFCFVCLFLLRFRKRWKEEKFLIDLGKISAIEKKMVYEE